MSVEQKVAAAGRLEFRILGPLEVLRDGASLELGPPKQRAILAALLLADGRVVSTDRLIEAVWGEQPPPRALSSVQAYVSKLRSLLATNGDRGLARRAPGYALAADWVDVAEFRRFTARAGECVQAEQWSDAAAAAAAASALWRGPFLDDLADEEWVESEAVRLDEMYAQCVEFWVTGLLGQNSISEAVTRSQTMVEAYPLREHCWWLRMIALHRAGRSPEALEAFQYFTGELDEQLGLEPGPQLRELQTAILRHDPLFATWPNRSDKSNPIAAAPTSRPVEPEVPAAPRPVRSRATAGAASQAPAIVGRDSELAALAHAVDEIIGGEHRWVLLTGRGGIGKTRLATETAALAELRGVRVLWTNCPDDAGTPAWWPLRSLARELGGDPDEVFLPPIGVDADTVRFTVYERFSQLLRTASAERPLVVVIDDAQWLDAASIRGLAYLAHTQRFARVGLLLTVRDRQHRPDVSDVLATIGRQEFAVHLPIGPLDGPSASLLLRQIAGDTVTAADAFALMRRIGGNPLLLTEYARLPPDERVDGPIPLAARGLLERRLHRLPEGVLTVLGAAGIIGDTFELDLLAAVTGLDLLDLVDRLDGAAAEAIIDPAGSGVGYQFRHGLMRDAVIAQLSVLRRQAVHARVADALAGRGHDSHTLIRRAQHLSAAMPIAGARRVVEACSEAARAAESVWDWDAAAQQWESALRALQVAPNADVVEREDLLIAQLAALTRAGRGQTVMDTVFAAFDSAASLGQTSTIGRLAGVLLRTAGAWPWPADVNAPEALLSRLDELTARVRHDPAAHARVLAALAVGNCYHPDRRIPEEQSTRALEIAEQLGDPDVLADALVGRVLTFTGVASFAGEAIELLDRLESLPHGLRGLDEVVRHNLLTMADFSRGDMDATARHLRAGILGSDQHRLPVTRVQLRWSEARTAEWEGNLDRAEQLIARAWELHRQTELYHADAVVTSATLSLAWHRGRLAESSIGEDIRESLVWQALAAAETGDRERGRRAIARRLADAEPEYWLTLASWTWLGHATADLNLVEFAAPLLTLLTPNRNAVASLGQSVSVGPVSLAMGKLRSVLGDADGARADLELALRQARDGHGTPSLLRTQLALLTLDAPSPARSTALGKLGREAERIGMLALARATARAATL